MSAGILRVICATILVLSFSCASSDGVETLVGEKKTVFSAAYDGCDGALVVWHYGTKNESTMSFRRKCIDGKSSEVAIFSSLMREFSIKRNEYRHVKTLSWGRLEQPDMVRRLVETAVSKPSLCENHTRGGVGNDFVMCLLQKGNIFGEIERLNFNGIKIRLAAVDDVVTAKIGDLEAAGIDGEWIRAQPDENVSVPYSAVIWFSIDWGDDV